MTSLSSCAVWFLTLVANQYEYAELGVVFVGTIASPSAAILGLVSCVLYGGWRSWIALLLGIGSTLFLGLLIFFCFDAGLGPIWRVLVAIGWLDIDYEPIHLWPDPWH